MTTERILRHIDEIRGDLRRLEEDVNGYEACPMMADALERIVNLIPWNPYERMTKTWEEVAREAVGIAADALHGRVVRP